MTDVSALKILLRNREIGTLAQLPGDRMMFVFDEAYVADENRPTLSLSFKDGLGELITDIRPTQKRLPPFFSNLLPEGALRGYIANRSKINEEREYFLLKELGEDLPGAVRAIPADVELDPKNDAAHRDTPAKGAEALEDTRLRFSLAGVQLKFSAVIAASGGMTIPARGVGGDWILKLPSATYSGVPENEFSMMELARRIGINVPETRLIPISEIGNLPDGVDRIAANAFAVRRFDRPEGGEKLHIEDFAQVFQVYPDAKYQKASYRNIAEVLWAETGEDGIVEFVKRLTFSWLSGNADMHLKNWSLIYPDQVHAELAPAYDLVSTIPYIPDDGMALSLAGGDKKFADWSEDAFKRFAAKARLPEKLVLDARSQTIQRFHDVWAEEAKNLPMSSSVVKILEAHIAALADKG